MVTLVANEVEWIKITTDMFDNTKIKAIRRLPEGNNILLIWVMLLIMAGRCNAGGMIMISENIPYTIEDLADETKFEINTVRLAIMSLEKYGMIYTDENCFVVKNWYKYQSEEGLEKIREQTKARVAKCREKKKLECNATSNVTCNVTSNATVTQSSYSISPSLSDSIKEIIDYYNNVVGRHYTYHNKEVNKKISARLNEGFTIEDFKTVIDKKNDQWKGTEFEQYLAPETLFAPGKFEKYLNQNIVKKKGNEFTSFEGKQDYDFDAIEKKILSQ